MARGNFLNCKLLVALVVVAWTAFLSLTQRSEDTSTSEPHTLKDFVELYKGVDSSPSAENTVLFALTTKEGVNFTLNWACWCSGLNLSYFIWATDEEAYRSLTDRGLPTYFDANASSSANEQNIRYDLNPEKRVWNRAGFEKMYAVLSILELGYDVFLSDIDVVILKNPWPHFARDADLEYQVEVLYSESEVPEDIQINVGWFLAKSNAKTLDVFKKTLANNRRESTVEQDVVNGITRSKLRQKSAVFLNYTEPRREEPPAEDMLVLRMMPMLEYPAGGIVFHKIRRDRYLEKIANGLDPVMVHFNLIKGLDLKEKCAHEKGYWRHNWTSNTCDSSYEIDYTNKAGCQAS